MTTTFTRRAGNEYLTNAVMTASPEKLVVMMYDGAITAMDRARTAITRRDHTEAGNMLSRAYAIVSELRSTLDFANGGEVALDLESLYRFVCERLTRANSERNIQLIEEARGIMARVKEGWDGIVQAG